MTVETTLHTTDKYIHANPNYNTVNNYETIIIPENYLYINSINGTYDKYFPLYALNTNSNLATELIDKDNNSTTLEGYLGVRPVNTKHKERYIGNKFTGDNEKIQQKKVTYTKNILPTVVPALSHIQLTDSDNPVPQYLIKILGNYYIAKEYGATKLSSKTVYSTQEFKVGDLIVYNNVLWECKNNTLSYPPETAAQSNNDWKLPDIDLRNIFNAQVFAITGNTCVYIKQVKDLNRNFNTTTLQNNDLVCWNISYWE